MSALRNIRTGILALLAGISVAWVTAIVMSIGLLMIEPPGHVAGARRSVDASNLRQIGQASLIYAADTPGGKLPAEKNIHAHAAALARLGGLNDASIWFASGSPEVNQVGPVVLGQNRVELDSSFTARTPHYTVVGGLNDAMPGTTPLAWTRGLSSAGRWEIDSAYGGEGGHIVFLNGNVSFYHDLAENGGQLVRADGIGKTADIREALPADTWILNTTTPNAPVKDAGKALALKWLRGSLLCLWFLWWIGCFVFTIVFVTRQADDANPPLARRWTLIVVSTPLLLMVTSFLARV